MVKPGLDAPAIRAANEEILKAGMGESFTQARVDSGAEAGDWNPKIFTSVTKGEGGYVFTPLWLFVTCKIEDFSSILVRRFCYSVCLFVCMSITYRSQF